MMKPIEKGQAELILEKFCDGYKRRDLPFVLSLFTRNTNVWGSGADEYRVGLKEVEKQLKRDWQQSESAEIKIVSFVPSSYDSNWAAAICKAVITINGREHIFPDLRGTIILEKEEGQLKIAHMHNSFPDYRNAKGDSFPYHEKPL